MKMYQLLLAVCLLATTSHLWAQCPPGQNELRLEIQPDEYWYEVSWKVTNQTGSTVLFSGTCANQNFATYQYCVPDNACTVFRIADSYGDGMVPDGFYRLYFNGELIYENIGGNYSTGENVYVGCPPGTHCGNPFVLDTGSFVTPTADETWYSFVPADTGTYQLSTCFSENTCPTKIWVYDQCQGITITNNQTGAIF